MPTGSCLRFLFAPWSKGQRSRGQGWQAICWGWYFGGEEFRETLEELAGKAVEGLRRESFTGEALRKVLLEKKWVFKGEKTGSL